MKIAGLEVFSSYTGELWTLEQDNPPVSSDGFDDSRLGHFHWKRCLKDQISSQESRRKINGQLKAGFHLFLCNPSSELFRDRIRMIQMTIGVDRISLGFGGTDSLIYKELDDRISKWRGEVATDVITLELDRLQLSIMNSVRDILFEFISSLVSGNGQFGGVTGYYITCQHDLPLYDWCLKFCKGSKFGRVCTLDLSIYLSQLDYLNLCYINRCFTAICSCFNCCSVYNKLTENHQDVLSNELLINLITGEKGKLRKFIQHNSRRSTLELILLEITLDIYQFYESRQGFEYPGNAKSFPSSFFDNCCSFIILKGIDIFNDLCNNQKNPLNLGSLIVDLFEDYVEIWDRLNLPVFIFLTSSNNLPSPSKGIILDDEFHMKLHNDQAVNISNLSFVKYKINLNNATLVDENLKYQTLLNASRELAGTDDLALPLMKLSRGYTLDDVKLLLRFTKCELMRNADMLNGASIPHGNILECYEQSTTTIKPISLTAHMPMTCTMYTSAKYINNMDIVPLEVKDGQVRRIHGFKSMILEDDTIEQLDNFFNAEAINSSIGLVIQGPHGSGKSLLAAAIAYELNCTLISANILDFVKPQVGLSEKLIHEFFSSIKHQFNDIQIGKS